MDGAIPVVSRSVAPEIQQKESTASIPPEAATISHPSLQSCEAVTEIARAGRFRKTQLSILTVDAIAETQAGANEPCALGPSAFSNTQCSNDTASVLD
jgi:hypothetical protein